MSAVVKVCGCRPHDNGAVRTGAGVPQTSKSTRRTYSCDRALPQHTCTCALVS